MMNKISKLFWALSFVALVSFTSCSNDDESFNDDDIIGIWSVTGVSPDFSVGSMSLVDYLVAEAELSELEAQALESIFSQGFGDGFDGTVEMKADNTYVAEFGDDPAENGTWELVEGGTVLKLLEAGEDEATELNIISINSTNMVLEFDESESEDLNDDGIDEEITITIEMTLEKL